MTKNMTYEEELRKSITDLQAVLSEVTFCLESVAPLKHKERGFLPLCDKARKILKNKKISKLLEH